jgi:hypothetical protein
MRGAPGGRANDRQDGEAKSEDGQHDSQGSARRVDPSSVTPAPEGVAMRGVNSTKMPCAFNGRATVEDSPRG